MIQYLYVITTRELRVMVVLTKDKHNRDRIPSFDKNYALGFRICVLGCHLFIFFLLHPIKDAKEDHFGEQYF